MTHQIKPVHVLVWFVEALILMLAVLYLAEEFGFRWVREAGGRIAGGLM